MKWEKGEVVIRLHQGKTKVVTGLRSGPWSLHQDNPKKREWILSVNGARMVSGKQRDMKSAAAEFSLVKVAWASEPTQIQKEMLKEPNRTALLEIRARYI